MNDKSGPKLSSLLALGAGFAVVGAALAAAGLVPIIQGAAAQKLAINVMCVVAGAAGVGLGGYFVWGYGWLKRRPELAARARRLEKL